MIGCPMAGPHRKEEFARWPKYKKAYMRAFEAVVSQRKEDGKSYEGKYLKWDTAQIMFDWWMEEDKGSVAEKGGLLMSSGNSFVPRKE